MAHRGARALFVCANDRLGNSEVAATAEAAQTAATNASCGSGRRISIRGSETIVKRWQGNIKTECISLSVRRWARNAADENRCVERHARKLPAMERRRPEAVEQRRTPESETGKNVVCVAQREAWEFLCMVIRTILYGCR